MTRREFAALIRQLDAEEREVNPSLVVSCQLAAGLPADGRLGAVTVASIAKDVYPETNTIPLVERQASLTRSQALAMELLDLD